MSVRCLDGPAKDVQFDARRAPMFLRFVLGPGDKWDVLDLLEDAPRSDEQVFVYRRVPGTWRQVFIRPGGEFQSGDYRHVELSEEQLARTLGQEQWVALTGELFAESPEPVS